jgi:hypothetical protein
MAPTLRSKWKSCVLTAFELMIHYVESELPLELMSVHILPRSVKAPFFVFT